MELMMLDWNTYNWAISTWA